MPEVESFKALKISRMLLDQFRRRRLIDGFEMDKQIYPARMALDMKARMQVLRMGTQIVGNTKLDIYA
ncbi:hypothetical protein GF324_00585 [bacterium]|nr:hypothetical protein [bacterium]